MHNPDAIKRIYASYIRDYGEGYNQVTFFQYIALILFPENEKDAINYLRQAANNLAFQVRRHHAKRT